MKKTRIRSHIASFVFLFSACTTASAIEWPPVLNPDVNVQPPTWDWQLISAAELNDDPTIEIYDIDMFINESTGIVGQLKSYGKKVICYVNVGAWEDWRDDETQFPRSILGNVYDRFPNEKWLDIRDVNPSKSNTGRALASILEARFDRAKQMGCDAVEPDNIDGFDETSHNPSGFPLTYEDQMYFNLWVSKEVRERGMAIGFKNNTNQALDSRSVEAFDFVVTESCFKFNECQYFNGFLNANKPVFLTEYLLEPSEFCAAAKNMRISAIQKRFSLDSFRLSCDSYYDTVVEPQPEPEPEPQPNPSPSSPNMLANGSFESGLFGWQSCGDANNLSTSGSTSQGSKALQLRGGAGCIYQEVPATGGEDYTLSCDASRPGTPWSILQFSFLDAQFNNLTSEIKQIVSGGSYSKYTLSLTAPPNTTHALALLYSEDQMLVDNCVLTSTSEPVPEPEPEPNPNPVLTNMLTNGSFESNLFGWQSCGNSDYLSVSSNTSQGVKALAIENGAGCLYQEVSVAIGEKYTLSCDATRTGTPWSIIQLSFIDAQYNNLTTEATQIATGGNYSTYTLAGNAPANASNAVVLLYSEDQTLVDNCVLSSVQ